MKRPAAPPEMAFFETTREPAGAAAFSLRLGELSLRLAGLEPSLERRLADRFDAYTQAAADPGGGLRVAVANEPVDYFIDPPATPEPNPILLAVDGPCVRYLGYRVAGWFDVEICRGQLLLARGDYEPPERAVENYLRAAVAWLAVERGGALVHAASAVRDGRGYLFYGESGAGKSTLSASNRRGRVISDDLTLIQPGADGGPRIVGSPFRGTYEEGEPVVGDFPLAAGFRIVKDDSASVRSVPRVRALAELVGNLPFVAESFHRRPELFERIERTFSRCPLAHLHFSRDDRFWDAIERAGL